MGWGFTVTLFTSSCRPSSKYLRNSWASCWLYPMKRGANLCIWDLSAVVLTTRSPPTSHNSWITWLNALIRAPFILLVLVFMSARYCSFSRYSSNGLVLLKHWITLFMKHCKTEILIKRPVLSEWSLTSLLCVSRAQHYVDLEENILRTASYTTRSRNFGWKSRNIQFKYIT